MPIFDLVFSWILSYCSYRVTTLQLALVQLSTRSRQLAVASNATKTLTPLVQAALTMSAAVSAGQRGTVSPTTVCLCFILVCQITPPSLLFFFLSPAEDVLFASPSVNPALSAKFTSSTGRQEEGCADKNRPRQHVRVTPGSLRSSQWRQSEKAIAKYGKRSGTADVLMLQRATRTKRNKRKHSCVPPLCHQRLVTTISHVQQRIPPQKTHD